MSTTSQGPWSPSTGKSPARFARHAAGWRLPAEPYAPSSRRTLVSRLALVLILCLQAALSLHLRNTAFEDEALYLYAGHMELEHLLHGAALQGSYVAYFSGSPVLYPVLGAVLNMIGGLTLVRMLSLAEMLVVTAMVYSNARYLFNERVGLAAAALFTACESTIFLGNFATFDATCLVLLTFAGWLMIRAARRWPFILAAVPVAALAVAVKYTGLLFVPVIAVLPALVARTGERRRGLFLVIGFVAGVAGLLAGGIVLGGHSYVTAFQSTTTSRVPGTTPISTVLTESAEWGGLVFVLAVIGAVAYVWRVRTDPNEQIAPTGRRPYRFLLGLVLVGAALLAPVYQAHLHTDISLQKHIGFGLVFAAPMAGFALIRVMGEYFRRPHFGIAIWCAALALGLTQAGRNYQEWPASGQFVSTFAQYLRPDGRYLVEVPEVPIYYLTGNPDAQPRQFNSTYGIVYVTEQGQTLTGNAGFTAAVKGGYFQVIAYNNDITPDADAALAQALKSSPYYHLAARVLIADTYGDSYYYIWVADRDAPRQTPSASGQVLGD
jgi:hypothetical protein